MRTILLNTALFILIAATTALATYLIDHTMNNSPTIATIPDNQLEGITNPRTPTISFTDTTGKTHSLEDHKGKIILLNFWASWCPPCIKEFPDLIKAAKEYEDDLVLIALSSDFTQEDMNKFLKKMQDKHPDLYPAHNIIIALDQDSKITTQMLKTVKLPETILINKDGEMTEKIKGADWHYKQLQQKINALNQKPLD